MATENTTTTDEELSLRDELDAAFSEHGESDDPPAVKEAPAAKAETPADTTSAEDAAAAESRARDDHGRFAPKGQQQATPAQAPAAPTGAPEPKPPASWRPNAREKWANTDPEIRAEVTRREHEMQSVLQDSAAARQFVSAFESVVRPYEMFIRAENANPLQAVQNLMQTAADLRVGTPQHKAGIVANIIQSYAVDIEMLDTLLANARTSGQIPPAGQQQPQQFRDPRLDMMLAQQQQQQEYFNQEANRQQRAELDAFKTDPKHEFYSDVAGTMADLVEIKAKQGQPIDLEKIYAQACAMDDSVSKIMSTRAQAAKASGNSQAVLRAKRAASSVKGDTTLPGATVPQNDSIRASIEAAIGNLQDT